MAHLLPPEIKEIYARRLNNSIQISRNKIDQLTDNYINQINSTYAKYKADIINQQRTFEKDQQKLLQSAQTDSDKFTRQNNSMYDNLSAARSNVDSDSVSSGNPWTHARSAPINSRRARYKAYKQNLDSLHTTGTDDTDSFARNKSV